MTKSKIALFIDVDNANISDDNFMEIIEILETRGKIAYGKVYGFSERKNKGIISKINSFGFDIAGAMRFKTRGKSMLDSRIIVDAIKCSATNNYDIFCIITGGGDLIPTYSSLKADGRWIIDLKNDIHEINEKLVDERIQLASEYIDPTSKSKPTVGRIVKSTQKQSPQSAPAQKAKPAPKPVVYNAEEDSEELEEDKDDLVMFPAAPVEQVAAKSAAAPKPMKFEEYFSEDAEFGMLSAFPSTDSLSEEIKPVAKTEEKIEEFAIKFEDEPKEDFAETINNNESETEVVTVNAGEPGDTDEDNYIYDTEFDSNEILSQMMELTQLAAQFNFDEPDEDVEGKIKLYNAIQFVLGYKTEFIANNQGNDAALEMFTSLENMAEIIAAQLEM